MKQSLLSMMEELGHEEVVFFQNKEVGLKAIVAIHNTTLGPALGGTRMWRYESEEEALRDVLRLSRAMTYKAAAAGLNLGGGKAVIIGDPKRDKSQSLFKIYGRCLGTLGGRYITAEDVNTDVNDMEYVYSETDYVVGIEKSHGGSGDPAPFTALGTLQGMKASLGQIFGDESLRGKKIAVQGVGSVGSHLVSLLAKEGAEIFVSDIDKTKLKKIESQYKVTVVSPEEIMKIPCDIFAPCAMGAVINDQTVGELQCKIVAGSANNQLDRRDHGEQLKERGILFAPDYIVNAGGLINVSLELEGYSPERAERMTRDIYYNLKRLFKIAAEKNISTLAAADYLVEQRLGQMGKANTMFFQGRKTVFNTARGRQVFRQSNREKTTK